METIFGDEWKTTTSPMLEDNYYVRPSCDPVEVSRTVIKKMIHYKVTEKIEGGTTGNSQYRTQDNSESTRTF